MDGVGDLSAYQGYCFLGGIRAHQLVSRENDALNSWTVADRIQASLTPVAEGMDRVLNQTAGASYYLDQLLWDWSDTIGRLCIGLRRLGTGGSLLISPSPIMRLLNIVYPFPYDRLGDSVFLRLLDKQYLFQIQEHIDKTQSAIPSRFIIEERLARADFEDRQSEVTGAVKLVTSLASTDGLVLLNPMLNVVGFGVKIGYGPHVSTLYDGPDFVRKGTDAKRIDPSKFGTRHTSMLRYCRSDRNAIGVVVSQDGHVRLIMSVGRSVTLWDNVKLLNHHDYSLRLARQFRDRRLLRSRMKEGITLGYTSIPKTISALLKAKNT